MSFADLPALATHLREELQINKFIRPVLSRYPFNPALFPSAPSPVPPA